MSRLNDVLEEVKQFIDGFEVREQQLSMMENVHDAMMNNKKAAIDAKTGTGKSFGYLLPYVAVKLENPKFRITINTNTIALQAQLEKDIDVANKVYLSLLEKDGKATFPLRTVTLKGNSNYFCEYRFHEAKDENLPINLVEELELALKKKGPRDKQNMDIEMAAGNWDRVKVESCLKRNCPFKDGCTYFQHYLNIDNFDIVVANHALFFYRFFYSDRFWENFDFHVFDESHKLEKGLLDASTYSLSMATIDGWIFQGAKFAERMNASEEDINKWKEKFTTHHTYIKSKELFTALNEWLNPTDTYRQTPINKSGRVELANVPLDEVKVWVKALQEWQKEFHQELTKEVLSFIEDKEEDPDYEKGLTSWVLNLMQLHEFGRLSNHPNNSGVIWTELEGKKAILKVTPESIDIITSPFQTGFLFTSGTIAINGSCKSLATRLNVTLDIDLVLTTPFPLHTQTLVYFSKDINPKMQNWQQHLEEEIYRLLQAGKQKTFVLFTSTKSMNDAYDNLLTRMYEIDGEKPLEVWKQDKGNYADVVQSFKNEEVRSILFGTMTYFEGIDLKGENLTQVILTRLPFSVPTHPIQEILDKKSGYSQWEALVRFEQAFGRLIRTSTDYGTFNVLDSRVSYMNQFKHLFGAEKIPMTSRIEEVFEFYKKR